MTVKNVLLSTISKLHDWLVWRPVLGDMNDAKVLALSRHPRAGGEPGVANALDPRLRGDDREVICRLARNATLDRPASDECPLLVLFHGLEGSSRSHYAEAFADFAREQGLAYVVPHFRGCGGELNHGPRAYHSGD